MSALVAMMVCVARADTIQIFDVAGTVTETGAAFGGTISFQSGGALNYDVTSGTIQSATFGGLSGCCGGPTEIDMHLSGDSFLAFDATFSDLVNGYFTQGSVQGSGAYSILLGVACASNSRPATCNPGNFYSYSGTLTSENLPSTPIPTALSLFVTGLLTMGLLGWRRWRTAAAVAA